MKLIMQTRLGIFAGAFVIGLSGALMPGPVLVATVGSATYWGFLAGPLIVLGHGLLELTLVLLVSLGLGKFLERRTVFAVIGIVGGAALLWMGIGMVGDAGNVSLEMSASNSPDWLIRHPIAAGFLLSAVNPYFIFWWATIGLAYISKSRRLGRGGIASFCAGHILSDLVWYSFIALGVALGRRFIADATLQNMIRVCAVILIAFGAAFAAGGIARLRRPPTAESAPL